MQESYLVVFRLIKAHVYAYLAVTITYLSFTLLSGNESIFRFVLYNKILIKEDIVHTWEDNAFYVTVCNQRK